MMRSLAPKYVWWETYSDKEQNSDCENSNEVRALENSGSDLEVAIKRLNEVRLSTTAIELDVTQGLDAPFQLKVDYLYIDEGNMASKTGSEAKLQDGVGHMRKLDE
ncbi:Uncharacterized protein Fot_24224 [Forsythia ovata]|uniref:Uncharacterized protein n=1 Tax=Forsythia ovata TaxID=205694 RepID=A0ABD1U5L2_9LAMI